MEIQEIRVDSIDPSPFQNRTFARKADESLRELAESLRTQGVLQNLRVRPNGQDGRFELICGERRLRAAKLAKLDTVPCAVVDRDDKAAATELVTENSKREDLSPLEEAAGVATLLELYDGDHQVVADMLGKPPSWAARRANLRSLSDLWRKRAADPDDSLSRLSASHLELVARLAPAEQDELLEEQRWAFEERPPSVRDLAGTVSRRLLKLRAAPWNIDDGELKPDAPACSSCPKRTSVEPLLFEDLPKTGKNAGDRCRDGQCWADKTRRFVALELVRLEERDGAPPLRILGDGGHVRYGAKLSGDDPRKGAVSFWEVEKTTRKAKGSRTCLVVSGTDAGRTFIGKPHERSSGRAARQDGKPKTLAERKKDLYKRRVSLLSRKLAASLEKLEKPPKLTTTKALVLAVAFGVPWEHRYWGGWGQETGKKQRQPWHLLESLDGPTATARLWKGLVDILLNRIQYQSHLEPKLLEAECRSVGELADIDVDAIWTEVLGQIKVPKSWANLRADGTPKNKSSKKRSK